jgi:hypothetical protein
MIRMLSESESSGNVHQLLLAASQQPAQAAHPEEDEEKVRLMC